VKTLGTYGAILSAVGSATLVLLFSRPYPPATVFGRSLICLGFLATLGGLVMMVGAMLRLPIALCVAQTTVTATLTFWADRMEWLRGDSHRRLPHFARLHYAILDVRETWRSINAPTFPLNLSGFTRLHVLGFSVGEILYLLAVASLWCSVGYFHERQQVRKRRSVSIAVLVWGVILLCLFIALIRNIELEACSFAFPGSPNSFPYGVWGLSLAVLNAFPYGIWGLLFIRFGVRSFRSFSQTQQNGSP
jgi:uncharacterized integral membrane protein